MSIANIDHYIAGRRVAGTSGRSQDVFNPASGRISGKDALLALTQRPLTSGPAALDPVAPPAPGAPVPPGAPLPAPAPAPAPVLPPA